MSVEVMNLVNGLRHAISEKTANNQRTDQESDDWKICRVCQDRATGYHFNAMTCEGCKGFFRRAIKGSKKFACAYDNKCQIEKRSRRHCSACRFNKCLMVGMKRECIMSDEQILKKRALIARNRLKRQAMAKPVLSEQEVNTIKIITSSHLNAFDLTFGSLLNKKSTQFSSFIFKSQEEMLSILGIGVNLPSNVCLLTIMRILFPMPPEPQSVIKKATSNGGIEEANLENIDGQIKQVNEVYFRYFSDLMANSFREIIEFSKNIPGFKKLNLSDQIALIKGSCIEMLFIKTNYTFSIEDETFRFGHINYNVESDSSSGLTPEFVDLYLNFHRKLKSMKLGNEEFAMMMAICLFSPDRSMVDDTSTIADIQHDLSFTLQNYMLSDNFPAHRPRVTFHVSHISGNFPQIHSKIIRTGNNRIFSK
jgi:pregnane X receptor